jgi:predicted AAA+ superfamily ATPase
MIPRAITAELMIQLKEYPVVTVLGPRQAGKTTLVREVLDDYQYVNLEAPDVHRIATEDPKGFLKRYTKKTKFNAHPNSSVICSG